MSRHSRLQACSVVLWLFALSLAACGRTPADPPHTATAPAANAAPCPPPDRSADRGASARVETVHASFRHVNFRVDADIVLEIASLAGTLVSTHTGQPPNFNDPQSFTMAIDDAEVRLSPASLTNLLNRYVFSDGRASLKDLTITIQNGLLVQKGKLHKLVDVPFTSAAEVSLTPEGLIRLHPVKMKAAGVPAGGLMKLFGLELDDLVKLKGAPGVQIINNDLLLDASLMLPAPKVSGRVTAVRVEPGALVQVFGRPAATAPASRETASGNYMYFRGGELRFGKLTMHDTDLRIVDAMPADPFDFFLAKYQQQLTAGYSKVSADGGVTQYMPDYARAAGAHLKAR